MKSSRLQAYFDEQSQARKEIMDRTNATILNSPMGPFWEIIGIDIKVKQVINNNKELFVIIRMTPNYSPKAGAPC